MILLPDEDAVPLGTQVNALIGAALRHSVAEVVPSAGFAARLAAALDAAGPAPSAPVDEAAGQGAATLEAAS